MPRYPHTRLFYDPHRIVVLSGPHIQVLDAPSGRVVHSSADSTQQDESSLVNNGAIRCSGMSKDGKYLATAGDDKRLKVWELDSFALLSTRELPKKPTSIDFSRNTDILVSDKFGDVFRYALHPNETTLKKTAGGVGNVLPSHESQYYGELVLGHASPLTCCTLTADEMFIITADRDEHIRVSWYPQGHVIENYCLGHKKYVSAIHIPVVSPKMLISGGGDHELKIWEWTTGRLHQKIDVLAIVEPFIRATPKSNKRELRSENDGEDLQDVESKNTGQRERPDDGTMDLTPKPVDSLSTCHAVLVVRRISSFLSGGEIHVIFSAVGATAIFGFIMAETPNHPDIRHHDFGKPVVDFTICGEETIWVLLDADFPGESDVGNQHPRNLIQAVRWSIDKFTDAGSSKLLDTLNITCSLPATEDDLQTLDLYSDLSSLPKNIDVEQDSRPPGRLESTQDPQNEPISESASTSVGLTKRALGRLKHKRAMDQLLRGDPDDNHDMYSDDTKKMKADSNNELQSAHHG